MANTDQNPQPDTAFPTLNSTALNAVNAQVTSLAAQLGYDGSLTVGALEDEIRFYQRRTVEACLELGKRLLLLKELAPHGEFVQRTELLGISKRMSQKFMSATLKFAKTNSSSLLQAAGNQSKLLELVVLDDGEIDELENGGAVGQITLDSIETMSVSELKKALREAKADLTAREKVLADKTAKLNELAVELAKKPTRVEPADPVDVGDEIRREATMLASQAEVTIRAMRPALLALAEHTEAHGIDHGDFTAGLFCQLELALRQLRGEFGVKTAPDGDDTPEWMRPGASEAAEARVAADMAAAGWVRDADGHMVHAETTEA